MGPGGGGQRRGGICGGGGGETVPATLYLLILGIFETIC